MQVLGRCLGRCRGCDDQEVADNVLASSWHGCLKECCDAALTGGGGAWGRRHGGVGGDAEAGIIYKGTGAGAAEEHSVQNLAHDAAQEEQAEQEQAEQEQAEEGRLRRPGGGGVPERGEGQAHQTELSGWSSI